MKLLVIDNYDSFVHNLARYFRCLGCQTIVIRNDKCHALLPQQLGVDGIVLSPGPCTPDEAGCSLELVQELSGRFPILGICLGHQAIVQGFGGRIVQASEPCHGRDSQVHHHQAGIFQNLPSPLRAGRYHSLVADGDCLPTELQVTGWLDDGTIMAVQHRLWPTMGVQFHPESILTEFGRELLENFLRTARAFWRSRHTIATCERAVSASAVGGAEP